jgi:hypothetical protein
LAGGQHSSRGDPPSDPAAGPGRPLAWLREAAATAEQRLLAEDRSQAEQSTGSDTIG